MPTIPRYSLCAELGCKNPRYLKSTFCEQHGGKRFIKNKNKHERDSLYHTTQWQSLRVIQLSQFPLCAGCESRGKVVSATVVDHIFPWVQIGEEAFFRNIYQSLCVYCHNYKTQLERKGIYRRFGAPTIDYTRTDYMTAVLL
jgi:5-methylcytosine-specific restriction enzyme A